MRHTSTTVALAAWAQLAAAGVLDSRATCNPNNCARAVTGTRAKEPNQTVRWADCASFLRTTVTPDTVTSVVTATVPATETTVAFTEATASLTVTVTIDSPQMPQMAKRAVTVTASVVPAYASPCTDAAAYSSACSCWGVPAETSTAPAPVVVETETATATTTTTDTVTLTTSTAVATTTTDVTCNGRPLGKTWARCADDQTYYCKCGRATEGDVVCFRIKNSAFNCLTTNYPMCTSSADCASGRRCQAAEFSDCDRNSCDPVGLGYCKAAAFKLLAAAGAVEISRKGA